MWHSNDKYRKVIWQCNKKFSGEHHCETPTLNEETVKDMFVKAYNSLVEDKTQLIADCEEMRKTLIDLDKLDEKISHQTAETEIIADHVKDLINENARKMQPQNEYEAEYDELSKRYDKTIAKLEKLKAERNRQEDQEKRLLAFISYLKDQPEVLTEWNEQLWRLTVEKAIVHKDKSITFVFKNAKEIKVEI